MSNLLRRVSHVDRTTETWEKPEFDSLSRSFVPTYPIRPCLNQQYPSAPPRDPSVHRAECLDVQFVIPVELIGGELARRRTATA